VRYYLRAPQEAFQFDPAFGQKVQQIVHWPPLDGYEDIEYGRERGSVAQDLLGAACMVKRSSPPCMISS
jgi:hypothetical protein